MPDFQYIARELSGRQVTGVLTATGEQDALAALAGRGLFPMRVDLAAEAKAQQRHSGRRVAPRYLAIFYNQLADLLKSGVPLLRSLELLHRQTHVPALKAVLESVRTHDVTVTALSAAPATVANDVGDRTVAVTATGLEVGAAYAIEVVGPTGDVSVRHQLTPDDRGTWTGHVSVPGGERTTIGLYRAGDATAYRTVIIAAN
jgi:type II secretory pathway component PulF